MALTQTLTGVTASTNTNVYTAAGDVSVHLRIVNDNSSAGTFNLCIATVSATPNTPNNGKIVPDSYPIAADSVLEITGILMNTTNEFLVINSSVSLTTIASAVSI